MNDYAVIMAGGSGTRLWPLSRHQQPKQSLTLVGQRTMFQHAVDRLAPLFPPERVLVVTRREHAALLMEQTPELPPANFIVEPEGRGTAPAIGLAAVHLRRLDSNAIMAVLTADHRHVHLARRSHPARARAAHARTGSPTGRSRRHAEHNCLRSDVVSRVAARDQTNHRVWGDGTGRVEGLVIVDTDDAVWVCSREHEQAVRELVDQLKHEGLQAWL